MGHLGCSSSSGSAGLHRGESGGDTYVIGDAERDDSILDISLSILCEVHKILAMNILSRLLACSNAPVYIQGYNLTQILQCFSVAHGKVFFEPPVSFGVVPVAQIDIVQEFVHNEFRVHFRRCLVREQVKEFFGVAVQFFSPALDSMLNVVSGPDFDIVGRIASITKDINVARFVCRFCV